MRNRKQNEAERVERAYAARMTRPASGGVKDDDAARTGDAGMVAATFGLALASPPPPPMDEKAAAEEKKKDDAAAEAAKAAQASRRSRGRARQPAAAKGSNTSGGWAPW